MNSSNISFGRIVKVNAPWHIANEIADIANGSSHKNIAKQVKSIFPDKNQCKCKVKCYTFNGESYLLSGLDAKYALMVRKSTNNSKAFKNILQTYINTHYTGSQINVEFIDTRISDINHIL